MMGKEGRGWWDQRRLPQPVFGSWIGRGGSGGLLLGQIWALCRSVGCVELGVGKLRLGNVSI